jgi:hypothetical protein
MAVVCCPHCRVNLHTNPEFAGQTLQCPNCRGAFIAPSLEEEEDEGSPLLLILVWVGGAHVMLFLVLAFMTSAETAMYQVGLAILIELAIWKRKELMAVFRQIRQSETTKHIIQKTASGLRSGAEAGNGNDTQQSSTRDEITAVEVVADVDDALVEIRPARTATSQPRTASRINQPSRAGLGGRPLGSNIPSDNVYFYGPGTELDLGRGVVKWPLVYATGAAQRGGFDASLIDSTLPVATAGTPVEDGLPYWCNYYDCSPARADSESVGSFGSRVGIEEFLESL